MFYLRKEERAEVLEKDIKHIDNLSDFELTDLWKVIISKGKGLGKKHKDYKYVMTVADTIMIKHLDNLEDKRLKSDFQEVEEEITKEA